MEVLEKNYKIILPKITCIIDIKIFDECLIFEHT